jgi:cell wall assembly regulator SMI1
MAQTIYVGGLSAEATEEELSRLLRPYGAVRSISLARDLETGQAADHAFVEMADEAADQEVVNKLNGVEFSGKPLMVDLIVSSEVGTSPRGRSGPAIVATALEAEMAWERLEAWLKPNADRIWYSFYPLALESELQTAEEALGVTLPDDIRVAYSRHNGQSHLALFPDGFKFCSLLDVEEIWGYQTRLAEQFKEAEFWHPKWIPITDNAAGEYHFVNLNPADPDYGRIFWWSQAGDPCPVAENLTQMIRELAEGLETSHYVVEESGIAESAMRWI